jgi:hypothetical protein
MGAGLFEIPPFDNRSMRSVYHTREFDVRSTGRPVGMGLWLDRRKLPSSLGFQVL